MRFADVFTKIWRVIKRCSLLLMAILLLGGSGLNVHDIVDRTRLFTRSVEFNYLSWTIEASFEKLSQLSLHPAAYAVEGERVQLVFDYLELVRSAQQTEQEVQEGEDQDHDENRDPVRSALDHDHLSTSADQASPMSPSPESTTTITSRTASG